jgi:hypothetical protein
MAPNGCALPEQWTPRRARPAAERHGEPWRHRGRSRRSRRRTCKAVPCPPELQIALLDLQSTQLKWLHASATEFQTFLSTKKCKAGVAVNG